MLTWTDVIRFTNDGNPTPDRRVEKTPADWREILTPEQYAITRDKGTERAFSSEMCSLLEPGAYSGDSDHLYWFYSIIRASQRDELIVSL
jgi:peptide-methionine (R)-S-oxide reductase